MKRLRVNPQEHLTRWFPVRVLDQPHWLGIETFVSLSQKHVMR
jgi:hypothetical protein